MDLFNRKYKRAVKIIKGRRDRNLESYRFWKKLKDDKTADRYFLKYCEACTILTEIE